MRVGGTLGGVGTRLALIAVMALACDGSRERAAHAATSVPVAPLTGVEFAGCSVVDRGARCELAVDRKLTVVLPSPASLAAVSGDGKALPVPNAARVEDGQRYELTLPAGVRSLQLRAANGSTFTLQLTARPSLPELERASALRAQGKYAEARAVLASVQSNDPVVLAHVRALSARVSFAQGDHDAAAEGLRASMESALAAGRVTDAVYDATALVFVLSTHLRSYARAREVLKQAAQVAPLDPASRAILPHYEGTLALETGDLQRALGRFRESARLAGRLGLRDHELLAREREASTLVLLGRYDEAVASQRKIVEEFPSADACQRADRSEAVVWFGLMAEPAPGSELAKLIETYGARSARELEACPAPWRKRNHQINAAFSALQQADAPRARAILDELAKPSSLDDPVLDAWERELRGRHALLTGQAGEALEHFRAGYALSERAGLWDNRQLAQLGTARALELLGESKAALDAYAAAERSLDENLATVPLSEGQAGFRRAREAGTAEWIRLLLRTGATERAFEVARSARARRSAALAAAERARTLPEGARERWEAALARYQERRALAEKMAGEAWQLPADQLSEHQRKLARRRQQAREALDEAYAALRGSSEAAPESLRLLAAGEGELVLGLFPDGDQLLVFVQQGGRTRSLTVPLFDAAGVPPDLGDRLLADVGGGRLRVIAHPSLGWLDLHGMTLAGAPILERFSVRYGTDTPAARAPAAARSGRLIVLDPRGDLQAAQAEERLVAPDRTPADRTLFGAEARRADLLARVPEVALLHYAGHHRFAGIEGTDSALLLADGEVSVGDVLTLPRGPSRVVLATCEGARYEGPGFSGGLGMAQAFIAIGAVEVIAATRPVPDVTARDLTQALYSAQREAPEIDLTEALRRAQLQLRSRSPESDWRAFRAIGR